LVEEFAVDSNPELPLSLERQLEDFLAGNLGMLEDGLKIFRDEEKREGRQYPTDVGEIDLLCSRRTMKYLLFELKREGVRTSSLVKFHDTWDGSHATLLTDVWSKGLS